MAEGGYVDDRVHRRCTWLNANVFWEGAIDRSAMEALSNVGFQRAMDMCKDIEDKGAENITNPSAYLQTAVRHDLRGAAPAHDGGWHDDWRPPAEWDWGSKEYMNNTIHKRCTWLNGNVFWEDAITHQVIVALSSIPTRRALDLLNEVEGKAERVADPSGFLGRAVDREFAGADAEWWGHTKGSGGYREQASPSSRYMDSAIHKRCTWLNTNVFWPGAIDDDAVASLSTLDHRRAMEMLKDIESRGPTHLAHPSSYLTASVRHEFEPPYASYGSDGGQWGPTMDGGKGYGQVSNVVHRRCTWLNANIFWPSAISEAAIATLSEFEVWRALELLQDLEWKAKDIQNPSKWIQATAENQWPSGSYVNDRIHRRCVWLNSNIFWPGAIDEEAIRAVSSLDYQRAMTLCADLEQKGAENVSDPARYLKTAVRREFTGRPESWHTEHL